MELKVSDIRDVINAIAPFETQESYDNAGLLTGSPDWIVTGIHTALDVSEAVLDEAIAAGANLIVTHHPMMFRGRKTMTETDSEGRLLCRMIRHRIALIAAHTNLDQAPGGINDVLAETIGLTGITGEGFVRAGSLPAAMTARQLSSHISQQLHTVVRLMGDPEKIISRVAVCSGSGGAMWEAAQAMSADAFLSGEIAHHNALLLADAGMVGLEAGHFATEVPGIFALADALQKHADAVQCKVRITKSQVGAYMPPVCP